MDEGLLFLLEGWRLKWYPKGTGGEEKPETQGDKKEKKTLTIILRSGGGGQSRITGLSSSQRCSSVLSISVAFCCALSSMSLSLNWEAQNWTFSLPCLSQQLPAHRQQLTWCGRSFQSSQLLPSTSHLLCFICPRQEPSSTLLALGRSQTVAPSPLPSS